MRKNVRMTFVKGKATKGYMGHWSMDYYVDNVIDTETNEVICSDYIFKNSTVFKGKRLKLGDLVEMSVNVSEENGKVKLSYFKNVKKVVEENE